MEQEFAVGGFVASLVIVALLGVWLRQVGGRAREAVVPYIGVQPARWLYGLVWTGYGLGALQALASAMELAPDYFYSNNIPSGVQFVFALISGPLLSFSNVAISFLQIGALLAAVFVVSRVLRADLP